jgi:hypothetical protein
MAKLTKDTVFKTSTPVSETAMDKTTRIVREIMDNEAEQRQVKMARLRNARLEREANTPAKSAGTAASKTRKKAAAKTT